MDQWTVAATPYHHVLLQGMIQRQEHSWKKWTSELWQPLLTIMYYFREWYSNKNFPEKNGPVNCGSHSLPSCTTSGNDTAIRTFLKKMDQWTVAATPYHHVLLQEVTQQQKLSRKNGPVNCGSHSLPSCTASAVPSPCRCRTGCLSAPAGTRGHHAEWGQGRAMVSASPFAPLPPPRQIWGGGHAWEGSRRRRDAAPSAWEQTWLHTAAVNGT